MDLTIDISDARELVARFEVPGEPVSKARARFTKRGSKTVAYTPEKTKQGEERVAWAYRAAGGRLNPDTEVAYAVHAQFFNGTMQRRDVDNMLKLILDGLNGIAYPDDTQVLEVWGRKAKVSKPDARTAVSVYRIGTIGRPMANCIRCGAVFPTYESWTSNPNGKKYCSSGCHYAAVRERNARVCEQCGQDFQSKDSRARFCSRACRNRSGRVAIPCAICGTEFEQYKSWADRRPYCSQECATERARRMRQERRTKHLPGTCLVCGAGTTRKEYRRCNPCKLAGKAIPA